MAKQDRTAPVTSERVRTRILNELQLDRSRTRQDLALRLRCSESTVDKALADLTRLKMIKPSYALTDAALDELPRIYVFVQTRADAMDEDAILGMEWRTEIGYQERLRRFVRRLISSFDQPDLALEGVNIVIGGPAQADMIIELRASKPAWDSVSRMVIGGLRRHPHVQYVHTVLSANRASLPEADD
jgi:DNA-binding Lrp family transcriptional regulator